MYPKLTSTNNLIFFYVNMFSTWPFIQTLSSTDTKNGGTPERRRTIMAASNLSPPSRALTDQAQWLLTARTQQDRQPSLVSKLEFITQLQEQSSKLSHT
jgi:hypothetical protein